MAKLRRTKPSSFHELTRAVRIYLCKDGTISYRPSTEPSFNGSALPVFSVDTVEQARAVQVRFGRLQYGEHPQLPGRPWYRWTDFSGDVAQLDGVSNAIRTFYHAHLVKDGGHLHGFPHYGGCVSCRLLRVCNACGDALGADRCTNG